MGKLERRLENRYLCADIVCVDWVRDDGSSSSVEAVLEDISALGVCVQVEEAIPLRSKVSISAHGTHFSGIVSYCVYRDYGYFVGIRFSEASRWSQGEFEPQHLTDLGELAVEGLDRKVH